MELSSGTIQVIHTTPPEESEKLPPQPKLQVLKFTKLPTPDPSKPERYRLHLSDGMHKQPSCMLATQLNSLITEDQIQKNGIIRLDKYICNTVSSRRIIIVLQVTVISPDVGHIIGNPETIKDDTPPVVKAEAPTPAAAAPPKVVNPYMKNQNQAPSGGRGSSMAAITPIEALNPYNNRWTIKVRITNRNDRTYSNAKGEGKIMSVDLLDETGEMRCTAFNDDVERLGPMLEVGKVVTIKGGKLKPANKKFSGHITNDYEMTLGRETEVVPVLDTADAPQQRFDFVDFAQFEGMDKENTFVDVLAICTEVNDITTITRKKDGAEFSKREVELIEKAGIAVRCTLWGGDAENFSYPVGTVIQIKAAKLSDFGGCSMSVSNASALEVNPDSSEAHELRGWYESEGKGITPMRVAGGGGGGGGGGGSDRRVTLEQIRDENIGMGEKAEYIVARGTITFVRVSDNMIYKACPKGDCNKKVIEESSGEFRCEKCNSSFSDFKYRMILSTSVLDHSGQTWMSHFADTAETVVGQSSHFMGELREADPSAFEKAIQGGFFKEFMFKCRCKEEHYNDESRVKVSVLAVTPVNPVEESKFLISEIKKYRTA